MKSKLKRPRKNGSVQMMARCIPLTSYEKLTRAPCKQVDFWAFHVIPLQPTKQKRIQGPPTFLVCSTSGRSKKLSFRKLHEGAGLFTRGFSNRIQRTEVLRGSEVVFKNEPYCVCVFFFGGVLVTVWFWPGIGVWRKPMLVIWWYILWIFMMDWIWFDLSHDQKHAIRNKWPETTLGQNWVQYHWLVGSIVPLLGIYII